MRNALHTLRNFLIFFLLVAFVITCCLMLFISTLEDAIGRSFTEAEITSAAKITMANVIILSAFMAAIDYLRRKFTVERPVKKITEATNRIMEGNFSTQIDPIGHFANDNSFNEVIACINKMAKELSSVETLRTDFIANVSHEMKTPLAVIQNYGTLLQSSDLTEEKRKEYSKGITDASRRLSEMITNVLKLNRLENQQVFPEITKFNLGEQLSESFLLFESVWEDKNIDIEVDLEEDIWVEADKELLSLVWNNLFSNAFKFTKNGGKVSLSLSATDHHAIIKVADTGCGISPQVGQHIFEKFYQGDESHATQGNGLGLALVKRVIDIIKGEISVDSVVGAGTTFTVRIRRK